MDSPAPAATGDPRLEGEEAARATAALRDVVAWLRARRAEAAPAAPRPAADAHARDDVASGRALGDGASGSAGVHEAVAPGRRDDGTLATAVRAASLAEGEAGLAVFFAALARSGFDADAARDAERHVERASEAVGALVMTDSFYSGFPGVVWALQHIAREADAGTGGAGAGPGADDPYGAIDDVLAEHVGRTPWAGDFDVVNGLAGLAAYALERLPAERARTMLEQVVARLDESAESSAAGLTWRTPADRLAAERSDGRAQGPFNLGVAHGVPGVLAALAAALEAGVAPQSGRLLEGGVRWLLAQRLPEGAGTCFAHTSGPGATAAPSRLGWCYGDLGIAAALHRAARAARRSDWDAAAGEVARFSARRTREQGAVRDAGVCHGAAGIAHLFHRLGRERGDAALLEAARRWCRDLLDHRDPSLGAAGFPAWAPAEPEGWAWSEDPGLLTGAAGVGMVLLGALAPAFMGWDRMLLVSTRAVPGRP